MALDRQLAVVQSCERIVPDQRRAGVPRSGCADGIVENPDCVRGRAVAVNGVENQVILDDEIDDVAEISLCDDRVTPAADESVAVDGDVSASRDLEAISVTPAARKHVVEEDVLDRDVGTGDTVVERDLGVLRVGLGRPRPDLAALDAEIACTTAQEEAGLCAPESDVIRTSANEPAAETKGSPSAVERNVLPVNEEGPTRLDCGFGCRAENHGRPSRLPRVSHDRLRSVGTSCYFDDLARFGKVIRVIEGQARGGATACALIGPRRSHEPRCGFKGGWVHRARERLGRTLDTDCQ
jgi:hypothetical protein